ncbi:MAG: histidine kinase dimerization/phospho-acceptor domain-containing protein [bacterium]
MDESYSERIGSGVAPRRARPVAIAEPAPNTQLAQELIAQLLPGVDGERLVRALLAERAPTTGDQPSSARYDSDTEFSARELRRVRAQFVLGDASRTLQHAFNNPLTALLAETQLLELEKLPDEHRAAVTRILELCRRLVTLSRRLGADDPGRVG